MTDHTMSETKREGGRTPEQVIAACQLSCEYVGGEELAIFWQNPYGGKREKIASFWWPLHPVEATAEVEEIFESLAKSWCDLPAMAQRVMELEKIVNQSLTTSEYLRVHTERDKLAQQVGELRKLVSQALHEADTRGWHDRARKRR